MVRSAVARFRGQPLDSPHDRVRASFDGPARAVRCACALAESMPQLRAGVHTGECELRDGRLAGPALEIAAGVARAAAAGEILATSTVQDLVAGSGIEFTERGAVELPLAGTSREWRLFTRRALATETFTRPYTEAQPRCGDASPAMAQMISTVRNGVDTQQLFGTLDADRRSAGARRVHLPRHEPLDQRRPQPLAPPGLLRRGPRGRHAPRGVRDRRGRADGAARHRLGPERGGVPPARARRVPDDHDRLLRGGAQDPADRDRVDLRGRHGRARLLRPGLGGAQRVQRDPRDVPRQRRRLRREAARARRPRPAALRGVRHAHPRRPRAAWTPSPGSAHPRVRASGGEAVPDGRDLVAAHDEPVVGARPAREQPPPVR